MSKEERKTPGLSPLELKCLHSREPYRLTTKEESDRLESRVHPGVVKTALAELKPVSWSKDAVQEMVEGGAHIQSPNDMEALYASMFEGTDYVWYPNDECEEVLKALTWFVKLKYPNKAYSKDYRDPLKFDTVSIALTEFECSNWLSPVGQKAVHAYATRNLRAQILHIIEPGLKRLTTLSMRASSLYRKLRENLGKR